MAFGKHMRGRLAALLPIVLLLDVVAPVSGMAAVPRSSDCGSATAAIVPRADEVMAGRVVLNPYAAVRIPTDPTWREDISRERNWAFQYHSLRWILPLLQAYRATAHTAYRDRASSLLYDWYRTNPRGRSPSSMAWNDHATAWRAGVYACAVEVLGRPAWLLAALTRHGSALADPGFYVGAGNHALNQDIGLLDVGLTLPRRDWVDLAVARLGRVILTDVDAQGVNKEGAVFYQQYIYRRARVAEQRMRDAGKTIPAGFSRVNRMPGFLAFAILPDGTYDALGDTDPSRASVIRGTVAEYAATRGASGPRPTTTYATYSQGFAFGRTGWGERTPLTDEIAYTVRFGPVPFSDHQHNDGGALTVYGFGTRLLLDPGKFTYQHDAWRTFFTSRAAHNVLTVTGVAARRSYPTSLSSASSATMRMYRVRTYTYAGTRLDRTVVWSTGGHYFLVDDRAVSSQSRSLVQRWHLAPGSSPAATTTSVWTRRARGNVLVRQLAGGTIRTVSGTTSPIQGWVSPSFGRRVAAPVIETRKTGTNVRFLTFIVPSAASRPASSITNLRLYSDGFDARVGVNGRVERVVVRSTSASVTVISAPATPLP